MNRNRSWLAISTVSTALAITLGTTVLAAEPSDRCDACKIEPVRPTPIVVGIPPQPSPTAKLELPNTDTAP